MRNQYYAKTGKNKYISNPALIGHQLVYDRYLESVYTIYDQIYQ